MSIFILLLALALWGVVHSFLASHLAKDLFRLKVGAWIFTALPTTSLLQSAFSPFYI